MINYPELERIERLHPGPQVLLGRTLYWTEKRDGSQIRVGPHPDNGDDLLIGTRHLEPAVQATQDYIRQSAQWSSLVDLILQPDAVENISKFGPYIVFGELLVKGKSPARFEVHGTTEFIVFDIYDPKTATWLPYPAAYQLCYQFGLPIVECWRETSHLTLDSLWACRDTMLERAKAAGREGVVVKAYGPDFVAAKEKLDLPSTPRAHEEGSVRYPPLPESEVLGAIAKAEADLGAEFGDKRKAMPLIARYVEEELRKHLCGKPVGVLFAYYNAYLTRQQG